MLTYLLRRFFTQRKATRMLAEAQRLFREGALEAADRVCAACMELSPDPAEVHLLRASIAMRQDKTGLAAQYLEAAVAQRDSDPSLHVRLAEILQKVGRYQDAALHFERALERIAPADPARPNTMLHFAAALQSANKPQDAELYCRKVLDIDPDNREALQFLAVLRLDEDVEEARSIMGRYIALQTGAGPRLRRALFLPAILQSGEQIDRVRQRLDHDLDELLASDLPKMRNPEFEVGGTAFNLAYHGRDDSALMRKLGRVCRSLYPTRTALARGRADPGGRIRIGFVSTYFYTHSIARTTYGLIKDLPRDRFEVHVFAIAPQTDDWSERIRLSADRYTALPLDLGRAREAIDAAALDILFFADIGMNSMTYFLAFWRLAPVQMVTWGHPVTTGIDTIDYFVSSEALEPQGSESIYTERLIRLSGYFLPRYPRPTLDRPRKSRDELGLPTGKHLYCCLQNLFKLHPDFDPAIRAILEGDPQAELVLLEFRAGAMEQIRRRFGRTLGALASRIRFLPRAAHEDYLQYVAAADVVLDPFHFGGNNSSCEALSLGIPVVTLPAFQLRGRFTLGLYKEIGIDFCIARSAAEYVDIALKLGRDEEYRRWASEQISARSARLFDRPDAGLALGDELLRIVGTAR